MCLEIQKEKQKRGKEEVVKGGQFSIELIIIFNTKLLNYGLLYSVGDSVFLFSILVEGEVRMRETEISQDSKEDNLHHT